MSGLCAACVFCCKFLKQVETETEEDKVMTQTVPRSLQMGQIQLPCGTVVLSAEETHSATYQSHLVLSVQRYLPHFNNCKVQLYYKCTS